MTDEDEWKKLTTEAKVQHKLWKARSEGYKECIKNFPLWDEGSSEYSKYLGLVKKFVTDTNELVRIQGLEAVLIFVTNATVAKKTCGEVIAGIVAKCFNTKPRLKEVAMEVCLMYIEIDKNEQTQEELVKGFASKQPKVAAACLETVVKALSLFGSKVISVKPLLKEILKLLDHRDKVVREGAKALSVEIYRWIGPAVKVPFQNVNPVVLKELEDAWEKSSGGKPEQTRFMRSQQDLKDKMETKKAAQSAEGRSQPEEVEEEEQIDPYDLLVPVEILSKLPKNFYEQIEAKKWQERKEMLDQCQKLCENARIEPADFGDLVRALKKVVSKDTNVMLVTVAAKCIAGLAKGIRKKFQPYASVCIDAILEKFKEKKPAVVAALQDAIDAVYLSTSIPAISETCVEFLENKNPSIKEQCGLFMARALKNTKASQINKAIVKMLVPPLLKNVDHSTPNVRDAAYQALGTMLRLAEKQMSPFIVDLDNLKMEKIKEYAGKSEDKQPAPAAKPEEPAKPKARPKTAPTKVAKAGNKKDAAKQKGKATAKVNELKEEPLLGDVVVEDQMAAFIEEEVLKQITNANWKERVEGLKAIQQKLRLSDVKSIPCQAIIKTLGSGKPGWKDNNFNSLKDRFVIVKYLAENGTFSNTSAGLCVPALVDKIGDAKCGAAAKEALTAIAEATSFSSLADTVLEISMSHKNPKIQSESLSWLSNAIREFGMSGANVKLFISKIKIGFAATNPVVRTAALSVLGTMTLYIGPKIRMFFESEKPAILQQVETEIEKCKGESAPAPTRGTKSSKADQGDSEEEVEEAPVAVEDLVPRVDISGSITDTLLNQLGDKNWKIRREALEEVAKIINEAKYVEPTMGELPSALKNRLGDSNKLLVTSTLAILQQLSTALGSHCLKFVKILAPGMINVLADSKPNLRQAALNTMKEWLENTNLSIWFEDEIVSGALAVPKHIFLRVELLNWLAEQLLAVPKLSSAAKDGLEACVKHLYSCCEDRSSEVRTKAHAALPGFIYHLGIDKMIRSTGKLSPSSVNTITGLLEKAKELVPARKAPASKKLKQVPVKIDVVLEDGPKEEPTESKSAKQSKKAEQEKPENNARPASRGGKRPATSKKGQEEESGPVLVAVPNGKEQRMKEEQKLKTIKWIFDTPREELVTQLKSQLSLCAGPGLMKELYHADFQHHLKALAQLSQAMEHQWDETIGTLDLVLRWITLRFYDKNPTVHMRCLEYLKALFAKMDGANCRMTDYEAMSFIPHLITKIGETKENIRKDVHVIIQQTTKLYPAGKIFNHLMQGLLTKNSRQKTECLDELGILINTYGIVVCQPTPPKALKEIATHIGDRDNGVRSAALNVLVGAYNTCGDLIYKYVGKLNDKDMSMLEERIKRSGKFTNEPLAAPVAVNKPEPKTQQHPDTSKAATSKINVNTSDLHSSGNLPKKYDIPELHQEDDFTFEMPQLKDTSCDELLNNDISLSPGISGRLAKWKQQRAMQNINSTLNVVISGLASADLDTCLRSVHQLDEVLKHEEKRVLLKPRIDQILTTSCIQIRMAPNRFLVKVTADNADSVGTGDAGGWMSKEVSLYKSLVSINVYLFQIPELALCASTDSLEDFIHAVVIFILDEKLNNIPQGPAIIKVLNILILKVFQTANSTNMFCALFRLLLRSMEDTEDIRDLIIKCLWRITRKIPTFLKPGEGRPPLQLSPVLTELNKCFLAFQSKQHVLEKIGNDMPHRTINTFLHHLCQEVGLSIFDDIQKVENIEKSELVKCVKLNLTSYSTSEIEAAASKSLSLSTSSERKENVASAINGNLSPDTKLSLIFKKVGSREQTKQGLQELYDFKLQYPDYDIEPEFANTTPLFRNYINRALWSIEQERKKGGIKPSGLPTSKEKNRTAQDYFERMKILRVRCGLSIDNIPPLRNNNKTESSDASANNQIQENRKEDKEQAPSKNTNLTDSSSSIQPPASSAPRRLPSATNVEDLKRRLEKIKNESRKRN